MDVLPLTREWIEMICAGTLCEQSCWFSLLRGSGLKFTVKDSTAVELKFSLLRRSGLKYLLLLIFVAYPVFSLLRGSGLKFGSHRLICLCTLVLPLTREWIEISSQPTKKQSLPQFSLLRGSGLKFLLPHPNELICIVLPLTREWIEMLCPTS